MSILVIGEALIDVAIRDDGDTLAGHGTEHVGGSPANVAFGLGALGHETTLATWIGRDDRGERIVESCTRHHVRLLPGSTGASHTSVARAHLDRQGVATYDFDLDWQLPDLGDTSGFDHVHTGSLAVALSPGGETLRARLADVHAHATTSYDPNIRTSLMGEHTDVLALVEETVGYSDVVKASAEDVAFLYPGEPLDAVLSRWGDLGPGLIVITRGPEGAVYALPGRGEHAEANGVDIEIGDTVGAGDSFMAGLVSGLIDAGLLGSPESRARLREATLADVRPAVDRATATATVTVSRIGAYSPSRDELI